MRGFDLTKLAGEGTSDSQRFMKKSILTDFVDLYFRIVISWIFLILRHNQFPIQCPTTYIRHLNGGTRQRPLATTLLNWYFHSSPFYQEVSELLVELGRSCSRWVRMFCCCSSHINAISHCVQYELLQILIHLFSLLNINYVLQQNFS